MGGYGEGRYGVVGEVDESAALGVVVEDAVGASVEGAEVGIYDEDDLVATDLTDGDGSVTLELEGGVYEARISKDGYESATETGISLSGGETATVSVTLQEEPPELATLTVYVTDGGGRDLVDSVVDVEDADGQSVATGETDETGCAVFEIDPASYTVVVRHAEYDDTATATVDLEANGATSLSLTLEPGETSLAVRTNAADDVSDTEATLHGELVTVDGIDEAAVSFEYRIVGEPDWESTAGTTRTSAGSFEKRVSGLSTETDHEFRAVAEHADEELREVGGVASFETERSDAQPAIDRLHVAEVSPPNPHADIEVEWEVSHPDGLLDSLLIHIKATDGSATETRQVSATGDAVTGVETVRITHGENATYAVTLTAIDTNNRHASKTETLDA